MTTMATKNIPPASTTSGENRRGMASLSITNAIKITKTDKTNLLGLIGTLNDEEIKELIYEVLTPIGYNLMVTPKEIDFVIKKLSYLISSSINHSLHKI